MVGDNSTEFLFNHTEKYNESLFKINSFSSYLSLHIIIIACFHKKHDIFVDYSFFKAAMFDE